MVNAAFAVGAIGAILLLGVFLKFYSRKKAYPLTLLLLLVGILLGPLTGLFKPQNAIEIINPFVTLALIMVLFDTGYGMKLHTFFRNLTKPLIFGILAVTFTTVLIALPFRYFLDVSWYLAVLFGALLASTDLTIIAPMLQSMKLRPKVSNMLEVESTVNSILSAVVVIVVINLLAIGSEVGLTFSVFDIGIRTLIYNLFVGVGIGLIGGYVILRLVERATPEEKPHITLIGALFIAFAAAELLGASGIATALAIGIVFGNSGVQLPRIIKSFGGEMELILLTFVYVILGAILDFGIIAQSAVFAIILLFLVYISRYLSLKATNAKELAGYNKMLVLASPRGIVCAVLTLSYASLFPNPEQVIGLVFAVILVSAIGVFFIPRSLPDEAKKTLRRQQRLMR